VRCRVSVRRRYNETQPVHDYAKAVREKVYVETPVDSDRDGKRDKLSIFVTRPKETDGVLKVATIVEPSPDFGGTVDAEYPSGRRYRRAEGGAVVTAERAVGRRELRPRVSENYFVSRGYAVLSAATLGTGDSEGCPTAIGTDEKIGMKTVIEWLTGQEVTVSWSTGNVAMAGKCYDGTLRPRWRAPALGVRNWLRVRTGRIPVPRPVRGCGVVITNLRLSEWTFRCDECPLMLDRVARNLAALVGEVIGGMSTASCAGDGKRARWKPAPDPHRVGSGYRHGKTHEVNAVPQGDGYPTSCRAKHQYTTVETDYEIVSHGWMDVRNRNSASVTDPIKQGNISAKLGDSSVRIPLVG
jgi:hypothetical protein